MSQAPMLKGAWTDAEKLALLLSIIKSHGSAPKWSNGIAVPEGRTLQASQKMYEVILKVGASVKMTAGDAVTPSGKRPRGTAFTSGDAPNKKAKTTRKPKSTKKITKILALESVDDESDDGTLAGEDEEKKELAIKVEGGAKEEEGEGEEIGV